MSANPLHVKAVILDLDGVIYRGRTAVPGAAETTRWLGSNGYQTYYFTNNSTRSRDSYVDLLAGFGITSDADHIVTSASLTAHYFQDNGLLPATALVVGEGGLAEELRRAGVRVVRTALPAGLPAGRVEGREAGRPIGYVVVGMDRKFTYRKLHEAQQAVLAGAKLIATNRDATYPVEEGNVIPGGGSIVAAVATACEREPLLIGKPSPKAGELIVRRAGVQPDEALIVGDRLETDILTGRRAGLHTCLVLTGISTKEEAEAAPEEMRPHFIIESIADLPALLESIKAGRGPAPPEKG